MTLWPGVQRFFEYVQFRGYQDIWLEGLSREEIGRVLDWVLPQANITPEPLAGDEDGLYDLGYELDGLRVGEVELLGVWIRIEEDGLAIDFWPGDYWDEVRVNALFEWLLQLHALVPHVRPTYADEGCRDSPDPAFGEAFDAFRMAQAG
jgi:hypothetical protein